MFNIREIIRHNSETFYDFDTGKRRSQIPRIILTCLVAILAAIVCPNLSDNLLTGFLAVQAILLGFTVNVMFFLLGNREPEAPKGKSLESQLRAAKLKELYHELFYNVSYFNLISVLSIVVAASMLLPRPEVPSYVLDWSYVEAHLSWIDTSYILTLARVGVHSLVLFAFYALAIEVIFSISRVIGRTSFYFERKLLQIHDLDHDNTTLK